MRNSLAALAVLIAALLAPAEHAVAQTPNSDDADVPFWQSIQGSKNPADFRSYLLLYPNGKFAPLARLRAGGKLEDRDPLSLYHLTATPTAALSGQPVTIRCVGFPEPALFDQIVITQAAAPEFDPREAGSRTLALFSRLVPTIDCKGEGLTLSPLPPGAYEARYLSRALNPEGKLEIVARVGFFY